MTRLLSLFGLMRVSEHERLTDELDNDAFASWNKAITDRDDMRMQRDDWQAKHASVCTKLDEMTAKFKRAVTDLEKQAGEIARLKTTVAEHRESFAELTSEIAELLPDALAMRRKRQRDRELKAAKAAGKVQP